MILPQQVTLLNTLTIGVPALFIMFGKGGGSAAARRSFLREVGEFALRSGLVIGIAGLVVLLLAHHVWGGYLVAGLGQVSQGHAAEGVLEVSARTERTYLLTTLVLLGLDVLLRVLRDNGQEATFDRRLRWLAVAMVPVYLLALYVPPAANFFEVTPLALVQWGQVLAVVVPAAALARVSDRWF